MKENKINVNVFDVNEFDYENYGYGFVKISKPRGKINISGNKNRPNYKGHQSSVRKGGKK